MSLASSLISVVRSNASGHYSLHVQACWARMQTWLEPFGLTAIALLVLGQVLISPVVGLADNGDYWRIMGAAGIGFLNLPSEDLYWNYVDRWYIRTPPAELTPYVASDLLLVHAARFIDGVLFQREIFDLHVLGAVRALGYLAACAVVLVACRRFRTWIRVPLVAILIIAAIDVGYVDYFNSFYSEGSSLIFLLFALGFGIMMAMSRSGNIGLFLAFAVSSLLFATAKTQNITSLLVLAPVCCYLGLVYFSGRRRIVGLLVALALVFAGKIYWGATPWGLRGVTLYNVVFYEILPNSPSPEADLRQLGLNPDLAAYSGMIYFDARSASQQPYFMEYFRLHTTYYQVFGIYLREPLRLLQLAERGAHDAFVTHLDYLGNFERESGARPLATSTRFRLWSSLREHLLPRNILTLLLLGGLGLLLAADVYRTLDARRAKIAAGLVLGLVALGGVQYVTVLLGDGGHERMKQLFLVNLLVDVGCIAGVLWGVARLGAVWQCIMAWRHGWRAGEVSAA